MDKIQELVENQEHLIAEMSWNSSNLPSDPMHPVPFGPNGQQALLARAPLETPPGSVPRCPPIVMHSPLECVQVSHRHLTSVVHNMTRKMRRVGILPPRFFGRVVDCIVKPGSHSKSLGVPVLYSNPFYGVPKNSGSRKYALQTWPDPLPLKYRPRAKLAAGPSVPHDSSHGPRVLQSLEQPLMSVPETLPSWFYSFCSRNFVKMTEEGVSSIWMETTRWTIAFTLTILCLLVFLNIYLAQWNNVGRFVYCRGLSAHMVDLNQLVEFERYCFDDQVMWTPGWLFYIFWILVWGASIFGALYTFVRSVLDDYEAKRGLGMVLVSRRCVHFDSGLDKRHMVHQNVDIKRKGDLWEVALDFFSYNCLEATTTRRELIVAPALLEELLSSKFDKWGDKADLVDERFRDVHKILGGFNIPADRYDSDVVRDSLFVARNVLTIRRARAKFLQQDMPKGF